MNPRTVYYHKRCFSRSSYKPHDGARKAERERTYLTRQERRLQALKSMLSKGLQPCFTQGHSDLLSCGNLKQFPYMWLKLADYKGEIVNPWGTNFDFGKQGWLPQGRPPYAHA